MTAQQLRQVALEDRHSYTAQQIDTRLVIVHTEHAIHISAKTRRHQADVPITHRAEGAPIIALSIPFFVLPTVIQAVSIAVMPGFRSPFPRRKSI